ncbi:MAG: methylmalonyl Co-A mutase-associated GTPase MeaB [Thermoanaerobaculia bacterium]
MNKNELISGILKGNERALGRVISLIENRDKEGIEILKKLYKKGGKAKIVGFTGPPGAGKSTIIQGLAFYLLEKGYKVGIVAVDPTSPFSGGALLGDRIRMQKLFTNPKVFIRSMATRGSLGGLAPMTMDVVDLLDIAGYDWILVETIGVGQDEVDVAMAVEEVVVVLVPGLGDEIQALKAGIMEIADLFLVNKADREGAELTFMELKNLFEMDSKKNKIPKILKTNALSMEGIEELGITLQKDLERKEKKEFEEKKRNQLKARIFQILTKDFMDLLQGMEKLDEILKDLISRKIDPYSAAEILKKEILC